jgi:predicted CXXCH cytochrome family protein
MPCTVCHSPHSSSHPSLLSSEPRALCVQCHADLFERSSGATGAGTPARADMGERPRALPGGEHVGVHAGPSADCATCHLTHASDEPSLLRAPTVEVCSSCHRDVVDTARESTVAHTVVTEGRACLNCHAPHGSPVGALMLDHPTRTCLGCHDEALERPDGTLVGGVHDMLEEAEHKHGAVSEGRCRGCHEVHGSEHRSLLAHAYTPAFYQRFEIEAYALCFECHSRELVLAPRTDSTTRFRDGERNLHYAHVVATRTPGRTCRACHATHTSTSPRLLASSVPYGQWEIPIDFEPTRTGGSCGPGCHRSRSYDRVTPVGVVAE